MRKILTLSIPSASLAFGLLLFYSQTLLNWWSGDLNSRWSFLVSSLALIAQLGCVLFIVTRFSKKLLDANDVGEKLSWLFLLFFLAVTFFFALKPAHLIQETDFLNYHLTLPKQHWLSGNWHPVRWTTYEFLSLPIQYAFSFLWIFNPLLNRLPQFVVLLFLLLKIQELGGFLAPRETQSQQKATVGLMAVLLFLGFRGVGVQLGTAMLDLINLYFLTSIFLAFFLLYTHRNNKTRVRILLFFLGLDLGFYLGHKSFALFYLVAITIAASVSTYFFYKKNLSTLIKPWLTMKNAIFFFLPLAAVWLPPLIRSAYYTGDPFYPVFPQLTAFFCRESRLLGENLNCSLLLSRIHGHHQNLVIYGYGHGLWDFIRSLFLVGLPLPHSVNNKFDYPLGVLWYFLPVGMTILLLFFKRTSSHMRKIIFSTFVFSAIYYVMWFMGSQQSRWLYPILLALALSGAAALHSFWPRCKTMVKRGTLVLLVLLVSLSLARMVRSQRWTWRCFGERCLQSHVKLYEDYKQSCPVQINDPNLRAYLNCLDTR